MVTEANDARASIRPAACRIWGSFMLHRHRLEMRRHISTMPASYGNIMRRQAFLAGEKITALTPRASPH